MPVCVYIDMCVCVCVYLVISKREEGYELQH